MCLVVIAWQQHADYPLIIAGNRDEFHVRPTQAAHQWPDNPEIVGGRDLQAGGTWLALHRNGRIATVTNYRDAQHEPVGFRSRGQLVTKFLLGTSAPHAYLESIDKEAYAGFNLLVSDGRSLAYLSNRDADAQDLGAGVYGVSNALLDSPWDKVLRSKQAMDDLLRDDRINETELFRLLNNREKAPAETIESTRLPFATAHAISAPFVVFPDYGTRSSSVAILDSGGSWQFCERRFDPAGESTGESRFAITPGAQA